MFVTSVDHIKACNYLISNMHSHILCMFTEEYIIYFMRYFCNVAQVEAAAVCNAYFR